MPRKGSVDRRPVSPDPVFGSCVVGMLISRLMRYGKRSRAEQIFYQALTRIQERTGRDPLEVLEQAMRAVIPVLEVRPRRVGGATYQVPMEVRPSRKLALGIRWIIGNAQTRLLKQLHVHLPRTGCGDGVKVVGAGSPHAPVSQELV